MVEQIQRLGQVLFQKFLTFQREKRDYPAVFDFIGERHSEIGIAVGVDERKRLQPGIESPVFNITQRQRIVNPVVELAVGKRSVTLEQKADFIKHQPQFRAAFSEDTGVIKLGGYRFGKIAQDVAGGIGQREELFFGKVILVPAEQIVGCQVKAGETNQKNEEYHNVITGPG